MLHQPGVTERLAKFVVDTRWNDLPNDVAHQAKRSLVNFFAVALTGCRNETIEIALGSLASFSGGKQATLIGRRERIDALERGVPQRGRRQCARLLRYPRADRDPSDRAAGAGAVWRSASCSA